MRCENTNDIRCQNAGHTADGGANAHQNTGIIGRQIQWIDRHTWHTLEHNGNGKIDDDHQFVAFGIGCEHNEDARQNRN